MIKDFFSTSGSESGFFCPARGNKVHGKNIYFTRVVVTLALHRASNFTLAK